METGRRSCWLLLFELFYALWPKYDVCKPTQFFIVSQVVFFGLFRFCQKVLTVRKVADALYVRQTDENLISGKQSWSAHHGDVGTPSLARQITPCTGTGSLRGQIHIHILDLSKRLLTKKTHKGLASFLRFIKGQEPSSHICIELAFRISLSFKLPIIMLLQILMRWLSVAFPPSRQTKFRRYPSRCPPAQQNCTDEPKGKKPGNRSITKAGNVLGT